MLGESLAGYKVVQGIHCPFSFIRLSIFHSLCLCLHIFFSNNMTSLKPAATFFFSMFKFLFWSLRRTPYKRCGWYWWCHVIRISQCDSLETNFDHIFCLSVCQPFCLLDCPQLLLAFSVCILFRLYFGLSFHSCWGLLVGCLLSETLLYLFCSLPILSQSSENVMALSLMIALVAIALAPLTISSQTCFCNHQSEQREDSLVCKNGAITTIDCLKKSSTLDKSGSRVFSLGRWEFLITFSTLLEYCLCLLSSYSLSSAIQWCFNQCKLNALTWKAHCYTFHSR